MCEIAINTSSQQGYSEVEISGTIVDFVSTSHYLTGISMDGIPLKHKPNVYYPTSISLLSVELVGQSNGLVTAQVNGANFKLSGDLSAFQKLRDFLKSLSNLYPSEHFHLDWFANGDLLAPETAAMSFVFSIEAQT